MLTINEVRVQLVSLICPLKGFIGGETAAQKSYDPLPRTRLTAPKEKPLVALWKEEFTLKL